VTEATSAKRERGTSRPIPAAADSPGASPPGWEALGDLLRRADLRVIRPPSRTRLLEEWSRIVERERWLDDRLFLGIIGGTGVGKSTVINAIAGGAISAPGDRRPTTSRVVAYRHRLSPLPDDFPRQDLAEPEAVHDQKAMERIVVLDFPDFDSVEDDHAAVVGRFLPRLDVLLVLIDDEKYADLRLFEVLRALPQAPGNLHFVLNKVDRLAER
jgi:predicted GTPase